MSAETIRFRLNVKAPKVHISKYANGNRVVGLCGAQGYWDPKKSEADKRKAFKIRTIEDLDGSPECVMCNRRSWEGKL